MQMRRPMNQFGLKRGVCMISPPVPTAVGLGQSYQNPRHVGNFGLKGGLATAFEGNQGWSDVAVALHTQLCQGAGQRGVD
jgi:hypothetical protein